MNKNTTHKRALLIWLAIYPLITLLHFAFGDSLLRFPMPVRTLVLTLVAVPLMVYVILPFYYRVFDGWLNGSK